ncbi:AAA family ATPase [Candidatus Woesearchaeota archaeon]|nr:AAA family ATPase [Candidatus Woesearchaeota archaeon]
MIGKKIAIVGVHGTGKTALVYDVAATLKMHHHVNVGVTSEGARSCPYLLAHDFVPEAETNIFARQLVAETDSIRLYDLVICDKSPAEVVMYANLFFPTPSPAHEAQFAAIEAFARMHMRSYDAIFRTTTLFDLTLTDDPMRPTDPDVRLRAHNSLGDLLDDFELTYVDLPANNPKEFIVQSLINRHLV